MWRTKKVWHHRAPSVKTFESAGTDGGSSGWMWLAMIRLDSLPTRKALVTGLPEAANHSTPHSIEIGQSADLILEPLVPQSLPGPLAAVEANEELVRLD
jgi:hypothetical protein